MLVEKVVFACALVLVAAPAAHPQACNPPTSSVTVDLTERFFDDTQPYDSLPAALYRGHNALRVATFDVDREAAPTTRREVVFGALGLTPNVAVIKLQHGSWSPLNCFWDQFGNATCGFLGAPSYSDAVPSEDGGTGRGTTSFYDFAVGDVNDDGWLDLVVGRRLSQIEYSQNFERDTVFLNRGPVIGAGAYMCDNDYYGLNVGWSFELPTPLGATKGATFGLALGHIATYSDECDAQGNCTNHLDLVTAGDDYGIRYYRGNGDGTFTYTLSPSHGPNGYTDGAGFSFRSVTPGDVDGDGDTDIVVTRLNSVLATEPLNLNYNAVWFNQKKVYNVQTGQHEGNPSFDPNNPFVKSDQPSLQWPGLTTVTWTGNPGSCADGQSGYVGTYANTYEAALGDMDADGDLDLVTTSNSGKNAVHVNNGKGFFGSSNSQTNPGDKNDGCAAYAFPPITASWTGTSEFIYGWVNYEYTKKNKPAPLTCAYEYYTFTVPGEFTNACTGVALGDVNRDGLPDVSFSNRNDHEELAVCPGGGNPSLPHLLPTTYEYVFINDSLPGAISFCPTVERIEGPNDGTSYAEMIDVNRDLRPDWLDANFSNNLQSEVNFLYWGKTLTLGTGCPQIEGLGAPPSGAIEMKLTVDQDWAGLPYQVLASGSGSASSFAYGDVEIPLTKDLLTEVLLEAPEAVPGAVGKLDEIGEATVTLAVPPELLPKDGKLWLVVVVLSSSKVVQVTNTVEVVVQ